MREPRSNSSRVGRTDRQILSGLTGFYLLANLPIEKRVGYIVL